MQRRGSSPPAKVVAPVLLVLGVLAASLLFMQGQQGVPARPAGAGARAAGRAPSGGVSDADEAHAAAGVQTGTVTGDVATRFQAQVDEVRARLDASPSDRDLILRLARLLHDGHRVRDALPLYRQAMDLDPADPQPYYDLASAWAGMGEWDAAAGVLGERLERDPGDAVAIYDLGVVRASQGRMEEARTLMESALQATSDGTMRARISETLARMKGA